MGGGPANADVVRSSCILTFPEETLAEPVPVDAWYLHAVGRTFLRRLARDRVGDTMRIALIMQPVTSSNDSDSDSDSDTLTTSSSQSDEDEEMKGARRRRRRLPHQHEQLSMPPKRYISVSSDAILREALEETFAHPDRVLVLHVISLARVAGVASIHVRPEINPNVSPEPVAPLGLVFPTLAIDGSVTRVPAATDSLLAQSASFAMSKSVYVPPPPKSVASDHALAHSASFVEEREYTWRGRRPSTAPSLSAQSPPAPATTESVEKPPLAVATPVSSTMAVDESSIPVARVISDGDATSSESDYVMLELQTGAGLGEQAAAQASTYFIASNWHVQADAMSASMRLASSSRVPATSWRWPQQQQEDDRGTQATAFDADDAALAVPVAAIGLDESFVVLERRAM